MDYSTGYASTVANECNYAVFNAFRASDMETLMTSHGYFARDPTAQTIARQAMDQDGTNRVLIPSKLRFVKGAYFKIHVRNNDLVPIEVGLFDFLCTDSTTTASVLTELDEKMDRLMQNAVPTKPFVNDINNDPAKMPKMLNHWKRVNHVKMVLQPGMEYTFYSKPGRAKYHSAFENLHASTYIRGITKTILLRVQGVLGHDTATRANVGRLKCALDYEYLCKCKFVVELGTEFPSLTQSYALDTISTGEAAVEEVAHENPE
jgi:transcriptional regulator of met regulon